MINSMVSPNWVRARAGTHPSAVRAFERWILACAGILFVLFLFAVPRPAGAVERASDRQVLHVLDRLAFGPTAADVRHVKAIGINRYLAEQLDPDSIPEPPELARRLAALETRRPDPGEPFGEYAPPPACR